jgi:TPP-dependent pyruvate/acetoin dehydrogenase alpha subunit
MTMRFTPADQAGKEQLLDWYRTMCTIREFEDRLHTEFATGEIPGSCTCTPERRGSPPV